MNAALLLEHFNKISNTLNSTARLRHFILDLAVRGKLTEQRVSDESATQLLTEINAEKASFNATSSTRPVPKTGQPFAIPTKWAWVHLQDICSKTGSGSTPRGGNAVYQREGVPFLRSQNVHNEGLRLDEVVYIAIETHRKMSGTALRSGDLLLNITGGSIGRSCIVSSDIGDANISQHVAIIRPAIHGLEHYLHLLILSPYFQSFIFDKQTGAGRGGLPKNRMDRIPVALPPLGEQHRIVAKVTELMELCDRLEMVKNDGNNRREMLAAASLHHINDCINPTTFQSHATFYLKHLPELTSTPAQIPSLTESILHLAMRGKLVPQDPTDQPASELLRQIQEEKVQRIQEGAIKKDKKLWEGLPKGSLHPLPSGWIWTCLQDLFEISRGGSPRPAGDPRYFGGPIPWITVREITKDTTKYLVGTEAGLTEEGAARSRYVEPGDLLLTNSGATLGVPKINRIKACMNDGVAVLRLFHSVPLNDFAYLYLQSQTAAFRRVNQGMGQPNLNTPIIASWPFPLPPLAEQQRIVARVEELLGICAHLESKLTTIQDEGSRLLEAVLQQALIGDNQRAGETLALS